MYRAKFVRPLAWILGMAIAAAPLLTGCGGDSATQPVVAPEDTAPVKGKDSMDWYKNNVQKKGGAAAKK
jgi:hypothetical protein